MISTVLVSYFLHQFTVPAPKLHRIDDTPAYIDAVSPSGSLTVEASSAPSSSVPPGANRVEMLQLRLNASCSGDVKVETVRVQRRGLGANEDIDAIYIIHRGQRISTARAVSSRDGSIDLNLRNFRVPACQVEDISVAADFSPNANIAGQHTIILREVLAGHSAVRIEHKPGDFTRSISTVGRSVGQVSLKYSTLNRRVRFGSRQLIRRFTLSADNQDDQLINAITFTNNGSASNEDLQNVYIEFRNRKVTNTAASLTGDRVRLEFDPPFSIPKNQTIKFGLRADVRASRSRTLNFVVEEEADIEAAPQRRR